MALLNPEVEAPALASLAAGEAAHSVADRVTRTFSAVAATAASAMQAAADGAASADAAGDAIEGAGDKGDAGDKDEPAKPSKPAAKPDKPYETYGLSSKDAANAVVPKKNEWAQVASKQTDEEGFYSFNNLPLEDEYGRAYVYRVVMDKPAEAKYVPVNVGGDDNVDNDWGPEKEGDVKGVTNPLKVSVLREVAKSANPTPADPAAQADAVEGGAASRAAAGTTGGTAAGGSASASHVNAYGQTWRMHEPENWTSEEQRSVDLGLAYEDEGGRDPLHPWRLALPKTGDGLMLLAAAATALLALCLALLARRRRKAADQQD